MKRAYLTLFVLCFTTYYGSAQSWNISLDKSDVTCMGANDGQINLLIDGEDHVSDTVYYWEWQDAAGNTFDTSSDPVQSLGPGLYTVKVTRISDGTSLSASGQIEESESALSVSKSVLQENFCAGDAAGSVQAAAKGGTGEYMYGLGRGADATEPDFTGGYADNGGLFESLPSNTYSVWVKDSRGCKVRTPNFIISEPQPIRAAYEATNPGCDDSGGQISITSISGGTPYDVSQAGSFNFKLKWKDASDGSIIATNEPAVSGLPAGTYQVIITDKNNCSRAMSIQLERGYKFEVIEKRDISCSTEKDGMIKIDLLTSNPNAQEPFSIRVRDAAGKEITSMARSHVESGEVTFSGLGPGVYVFEVTDALGCVKKRQAQLGIPDKLSMGEVLVTNLACKGGNSGEIRMSATGGSGNYLFSIDSGATYSPDSVFLELSAGTYDLFLRDEAGCTVNAGDVVITEPSTGYQVEEVKVTDVLCNGEDDGAIELFFSDSTDPSHLDEDEDIRWFNASGELMQVGSQIATDLSEGRYEVRISDDYGCKYSKVVSVNKTYELRADFSMAATRYAVDYPVTFRDKSMGDGITSWLWDFGNGERSTMQDPEMVFEKTGRYIVKLEIQNEVGCSTTATDTITIKEGFFFTVPSAFSPNGDLLNDTFRPSFDNVTQIRMRVINKDGIIVYASDDLSAAWDGEFEGAEAPQGLYYYEMEFTTGSGAIRKKKGKVFLLR